MLLTNSGHNGEAAKIWTWSAKAKSNLSNLVWDKLLERAFNSLTHISWHSKLECIRSSFSCHFLKIPSLSLSILFLSEALLLRTWIFYDSKFISIYCCDDFVFFRCRPFGKLQISQKLLLILMKFGMCLLMTNGHSTIPNLCPWYPWGVRDLPP